MALVNDMKEQTNLKAKQEYQLYNIYSTYSNMPNSADYMNTYLLF